MEFCDECGSMMKTEDGTWVCGSCGYEKARDSGSESAMVTTQGQEESEIVDTSGGRGRGHGTDDDGAVPQCDNDQAFWEMKQIRSADESETRFLTCTECEHKWREDDH